MKNLKFLNCLALFVSFSFAKPCAAGAQELVHNGNFEMYVNCPWGLSGVNSMIHGNPSNSWSTVMHWSSAHLLTNADYLSACGTVPDTQTPENFYGFRAPRSGQAYIGVSTYSGGKSQCIITELARPLVKDSIYSVRFFTSPAGCGKFAGGTKGPTVIGVREMGAHFSMEIPAHSPGDTLTLDYHVINDTSKPMTDTTRWYEVSGLYTAKGGEQWMVVGRLHSAFSVRSRYDTIRAGLGVGSLGYNYIDDVSVMPVGKLAAPGTTTTRNAFSGVTIAPNPVMSRLYLTGLPANHAKMFVVISDMTGKTLQNQTLESSEATIDVTNVPPGLYLLRAGSGRDVVVRRFWKQ